MFHKTLIAFVMIGCVISEVNLFVQILNFKVLSGSFLHISSQLFVAGRNLSSFETKLKFLSGLRIQTSPDELSTKLELETSTSKPACSPSSTTQIEQKSELFKLDVDCFEQYFDHLLLKALIAFGLTCQQAHQSVGEFFRRHFLTKVIGNDGNIYLRNPSVEVDCFKAYVRKIRIEDGNLRIFRPNHFSEALTAIEFASGELRYTDCVRDILKNVKTLKFIDSKLNGEFHEIFLKHCAHLKRLSVRDIDLNGIQQNAIIGKSNDWLDKTYSSLEHFEVESQRGIDKVIDFLQNNSNIQRFSTNIDFLAENRDFFLKSKIKLNILAIMHANTNKNQTQFDAVVKQLEQLKESGIFQHLHLYFCQLLEDYIYPANLLSIVKVLHVTNAMQFNMSALVKLKQLYLAETSQIEDLGVALKRTTKLKYVQFAKEKINNVIPFIRQCPQLKKIRINTIINGTYFNEGVNVLDLSALNNQREKLANARKLIIYVDEMVYLATKQSMNGTEFKLVDIQRIDSDDETHDFHL